MATTLRHKFIDKQMPAVPGASQVVQWPDLVKRLRAAHGKRMLRPVDSVLHQRETER